jgi:hypothetical protein
MPMKSKAQRRYLWATHPDIARRWENVTPKGAKLPEHVKKAVLESFIKIARGLKKLPPVPDAVIEQQEAQMAVSQHLKGMRPAAKRVALSAKIS